MHASEAIQESSCLQHQIYSMTDSMKDALKGSGGMLASSLPLPSSTDVLTAAPI